MPTPWCRKSGDGWLLDLHVQPGAKQSEIVGLHGDALKIRIASPPVDGRANERLVEFIAAALQIPRHSVEVVKGQKARRKTVRVAANYCDPMLLLQR